MQKTLFLPAVRLRLRKTLPFWLILPAILVILAVQVYPALYTGWLSLQDRTPGGWNFVGLGNFARLFNSNLFNQSAGLTLVFLIGYSSLTLFLGFLIALLLKRSGRLSGFYITLLFIPWVIADVIAGLVFRLLVVPDYGLFSGFLQNPAIFPPRGISVLTAAPPTPWLGSFPFPPSPAMVYLILAAAWKALPFVTLLILAALQTIPLEVTESARIDGAGGFQLARHITLPLILPALVICLFNLFLGGINGVGTVFSLTGGGPGTSTYVLSYLLYNTGWTQLEFGRAAALALIMAAANWVLIFWVLRVTRVHERSR
jgi:multiple sugar transport system permease protein